MRALSVWRALGDRREEAATLSVIGSLYYSLGPWNNGSALLLPTGERLVPAKRAAP